jgi:thiamine-phosphate pyrophosphorylase
LLLYYITDRQQLGGTDPLLERIAAAALLGVDWIQIREKDLSTRELEHLVRRAREAVIGTGVKLLVNGRVDVAIACGLDGVHLTSSPDELPASEARAMFAKAGNHRVLIGVSCHTVQEMLSAESHGADFVVFGPIFGKGEGRALGAESLRAARAALPPNTTLKVLALGGVELANASACLQAGADGIAGIRLFQQTGFGDSVRRLRALVTSSSQESAQAERE